MKISHNDSLRHILRLRPLAVEYFESASRRKVWENLDESLAVFCRQCHLDFDTVRERLTEMPAVPEDTEWGVKPLFYLIDYLTQNHVRFRERDMPQIAHMLDQHRLPPYPDKYVIKLLIQEFQYFQSEFLRHMDEEETFLFPKIMHNEACFRYKELTPEIYKGSVNLFLKLETHKPEAEFKRMIVSIREKLRNQFMHKPTAVLTDQVTEALESFEKRLLAHTDLETDVLFPLSGRMEEELYEGSAPGLSRFPGDQ